MLETSVNTNGFYLPEYFFLGFIFFSFYYIVWSDQKNESAMVVKDSGSVITGGSTAGQSG